MDKHGVGGFGGLIRRKKGAVAMRINYNGILMEFISCHLSGKSIYIYIHTYINFETNYKGTQFLRFKKVTQINWYKFISTW